MIRVAIVADIHLHDMRGGYGSHDPQAGGLALRTWDDTLASTRVFNESEAALRAILADIARRAIHTVVLPGDLTDDGQPGAYAALQRLLGDHERRFGTRFFATFGNHDAFGPAGRSLSKRLTDAQGDPLVVPPMRGLSTSDAITATAGWGLMPREGMFHWETPFGTDPGLAARRAPGSVGGQIDASYLVEPVPGLWLLMLDANVFDPQDGDWHLRADAAWDHALAARPYLTAWIAGVVARAKAGGKALLAASHYPMVAFDAPAPDAGMRVPSPEIWMRRMPSHRTSERLAATGLGLHVSGHMHIPGSGRAGGLTNIALPSPVAAPGGYAIAEVTGTAITVKRIPQPPTPGFDEGFPAYERSRSEPVTFASYDAFLAYCAAAAGR
ncbi:metallophosphoesterase family protein [Falsirhodobacter halotolerans]|uniref:metallophosphoesterase family protein n=1 Tax=Falsirhodobacter halotolerans TaxID=1146892 RepID=UPI001FD388A2|nr:metallophosphoesterase [Falsirhodobacter halotolerans]